MTKLRLPTPDQLPTRPLDLLALAADHYNCYPGEQVQFFLRVALRKEHEGRQMELLLHLPNGLAWEPTWPAAAGETIVERVPYTVSLPKDCKEETVLGWQLASFDNHSVQTFRTNARLKLLVESREETPADDSLVNGLKQPLVVVGAELRCKDIDFPLASTEVCLHRKTQGRLPRYLPAIYQDNDLLGRFLMGFESFWNQVEEKIDGSERYYDPHLTPTVFLPWLASWLGAWDSHLPEERQRQLVSSAMDLYRRRGTRQGLEKLLSLYSGGTVRVIENDAENLVLGPDSRLDHSHALGRENYPHSFTVLIDMTCEQLYAFYGREPYRGEDLFRQRMEALINTQKPAHTSFRLIINGQPQETAAAGETRSKDD